MREKRRFRLPKGFRVHRGGPCPVPGEQYVEAIIRTADGFGSSGVMLALMFDWTWKAHEPEGGLGEVVGYRLAERGEQSRHGPQERF